MKKQVGFRTGTCCVDEILFILQHRVEKYKKKIDVGFMNLGKPYYNRKNYREYYMSMELINTFMEIKILYDGCRAYVRMEEKDVQGVFS